VSQDGNEPDGEGLIMGRYQVSILQNRVKLEFRAIAVGLTLQAPERTQTFASLCTERTAILGKGR